jgi:parallel beta-helix repeat protein
MQGTVEVLDNQIYVNKGAGAAFFTIGTGESTASATISGNDITDNVLPGIGIVASYPGSAIDIKDNYISGNGEASGYTGIHLYQTSGDVTIYDNVIQDNTGDGIYVNQAYSPGIVTVRCNDISDNTGDGVHVSVMDSNHLVDLVGCNDIYDNDDYGVYNESEYWIDATGNWWSDVSGPGGEGPGDGDEVSDYVIYDDWLYAPCGEEPEDECGDLSASITPSVTMGEAPLTVQFYGYASNNDVDWKWTFGTGDKSTSRSPAYTFNNEGTYTVTLKVTDACDQTDSVTVTIAVEDSGAGIGAPDLTVTSLNVSPTYVNPGDPVQITATIGNFGGTWGSGNLQLLVNGYLEQEDGVGLAAGTSETNYYTVYRTTPGEYQVTLGGTTVTFYVMEEAEQTSQTPMNPWAGGDLGTGGIIAIICIAVILVAGIVIVFLFARQT